MQKQTTQLCHFLNKGLLLAPLSIFSKAAEDRRVKHHTKSRIAVGVVDLMSRNVVQPPTYYVLVLQLQETSIHNTAKIPPPLVNLAITGY